MNDDVIKLHQPEPALGVPNLSSFCVKLETWFRMINIKYKIVPCANPSEGPKGEIPFVSITGDLMGDSELIIRRIAKERDLGLSPGMSPNDLATPRATKKYD
jgi:hypothetical protein